MAYQTNSKAIVIFITGASGVGKSSVVAELRRLMSSFAIHDFDEVGVPRDVDEAWRHRTTNYWLQEARKNFVEKKSTIICGVSKPDEVLNSPEMISSLIIRFGIIKVRNEILEERLTARGWSKELIQANINWAKVLEDAVRTTNNHKIISGEQPLPKVAFEIKKWVEDQLAEISTK